MLVVGGALRVRMSVQENCQRNGFHLGRVMGRPGVAEARNQADPQRYERQEARKTRDPDRAMSHGGGFSPIAAGQSIFPPQTRLWLALC